jgi:hypothetical protein
MLRLIHNQTVQGGILVDDIDDGLPNKEVHRLGSTADPKAYERDGYANKPKQSCYVPYSRATYGFPTIPGYINVNQTNRVTLSAGKGKIYKLSLPVASGGPGLITVVSFTASQIAAPVVTGAAHGPPVAITGTTFLSVSPDITSVTFAQGTGVSAPVPATLTSAQIIAAGGSVSGTAISIPGTAFTTAPVVNNTVFVSANEQNSNTFTLT